MGLQAIRVCARITMSGKLDHESPLNSMNLSMSSVVGIPTDSWKDFLDIIIDNRTLSA